MMAGFDDYMAKAGELLDNEGNLDTDKTIELVKTIYNRTAGFFTPYKSGADFGLALSAPVLGPLVLGTLAAICAIGAAVAAVTFIGSLMFAAGSLAFDSELAESAVVIGVIAGAITLGLIAASLALVVGILVCTPVSLVQIPTRGLATMTNACCGVPADEEDEMEYMSLSFQ
jgi:hypothetical protein